MDPDDVISNRRIIRPQLLWSGSRCFRVVGDYCGDRKPVMLESLETTEMEREYVDEDLSNNEWNIKKIRDNFFEANLLVPSICFGFICGVRNKTRSDIEKQTNTRITIPGPGKTGDFVVSGSSEQGVHRACDRVMLKVAEKRAKSTPTHFASIPVSSSAVREAFDRFKKEVLKYPDIDELLFQNPMKLHLTMAMLTLLDEREMEKACQVLEEFTMSKARAVSQCKAISFRLQGLEIMSDDPTAVRVLFGQVEGEGKEQLQQIGDELIKVLAASGLGSNSNQQQSRVKLHATLMNSKFKALKLENSQPASVSQTGGRTRDVPRRMDFSFNAAKILEELKHFNFGSVQADRLRLSVCGSQGPDGSHQYISEHLLAP